MVRTAAILLGAMVATAVQAATPAAVWPDPVAMHVVGRTATIDGKTVQQWPGTYLETEFNGRAIASFGDGAYYAIYDNGRKRKIIHGGTFAFGRGPHTVRIEKLSETNDRPDALPEIHLGGGSHVILVPEPRSRQIEVIGDSYAAGYGTTSRKRDCTRDEIRATTDTQQAFGPLLARHYDADYQINAVSGIGMVRNYGGVEGDTMAQLYPYALFDRSVTYDDPSWQPQIVVIALGDNDFATNLANDEKWPTADALREDFIATYVRFVQALRMHDPKAAVILMDFNEPTLPAMLGEVAGRLKAAGDDRVWLYHPGGGDFEQTGCDWHLNLNDHKRLAAGLEAFIESQPGIWP